MTVMTRRGFVAGVAAAAAGGPGASLLWPAAAQQPRFIRIATGPTESGYFAVGTLLGNVVSSPPGARECERGGSCGVPGVIAVTQTTAGSAANVDLIGKRQIETGLAQADVAHWAFNGSGPYRRTGAITNLRAIANLYPEALHVVARKNDAPADLRRLKGRVVAIGEQNSGTPAIARAVLQAAGYSERDVKTLNLRPAKAVDALADEVIDAIIDVAGAPSTTYADLAAKVDVVFLPVDGAIAARLRGANPYLAPTTIPADAYKGVGEISTVGLGVLWLVGAEVEDQLVHGLVKALFHPNNRRLLDAGHPFGRRIRPETATDGVALQLHPGAAKYYIEAGIIG